MNDKTIVNKAYQEGYANGYRRGAKSDKPLNGDKIEHMYVQPMYVPYLPMTYYTAVIALMALFLIFILVLSFVNERPIGYITKYRGDCLLKLSSTYSGIECV